MKIAVIGATGTAGSRTVSRLVQRGVEVVEVSRSGGVDLISGEGLEKALEGVDVAIDTSNAFPPDASIGMHDALTAATRHVVNACASQRIEHLVFLSIAGVEDPAFDGFDYYVAKRAQEEIVANGSVPATVIKSTQWYEFATNPAAVVFHDDEVLVEDWLIQPIAADTVADVLVETALAPAGNSPITITGPETVRLPELTSQMLTRLGDTRSVRTTTPALPSLATGVLLAPMHPTVHGPDIKAWLHTLETGNSAQLG